MKRLLFACLIVPFMFVAANATSIGEVKKVNTWATIEHWGRPSPGVLKEPLFARDDVSQHDIIETPKNGAAWIIFNDDSELFIAQSSEVILSRFVYDGENQDGSILRMTKGVFRFISGKLQSDTVHLTTPVSTIGIRGTDIEVTHDELGTTVTAFEGNVIVNIYGGSVTTDGCQTVIIPMDGHVATISPCQRGPSIGPSSFSQRAGGGTFRSSSIESASAESAEPAGSPDEGPDQSGHQNQEGKGHSKGKGKGHAND